MTSRGHDANKENLPADLLAKKRKMSKKFSKLTKNELPAIIPIDPECPAKSYHIYREGGTIYDVLLNQTNAAQNNNKFYKIQILESDGAKSADYKLWFRWGRVGYRGDTNLRTMTLSESKTEFLKKFELKTGNRFHDRGKFVKYNGKYDMIKIDYSKKGQPIDGVVEDESIPSGLNEKVKHVVDTICDLKAMKKYLRKMNFDTSQTPLGGIRHEQIKAGYSILTKIEKMILNKSFNAQFKRAIDDYYTTIPHYFGRSSPPLIKTIGQLREEIQLLEAMTDAMNTSSAMNEAAKEQKKVNPSDRNYRRLQCDIKPVPERDSIFTVIKNYLRNTHGPTHLNYKMQLKNVFELKKPRDDFDGSIGGNMLLWHGSRLSNWFGILRFGLRIAPPEAPVTGYMFGKGIYFADCSSKSANYCDAKPGDTGFLLLSQVALGSSQQRVDADDKACNLPHNVHSTMGVGGMQPNPANNRVIRLDGCDVQIPTGRLVKKQNGNEFALVYNEYVVYDPKQVRLRYLVEVKFQAA